MVVHNPAGTLARMTQWQQDPYQRRPVDIDAYAPPRRSGGTWWFGVIGVVLVAVVLTAVLWRPPLAATVPGSTPAATAPAAEPAGPGMPFTMPGSTVSHGRWEITGHAWTDQGVVVKVKVTADAGRISYGFVAFSNSGTDVYEPVPGAPTPEIGSGSLAAGQSIEGHLLLALPRGASTLILTTAQGRQVSALPIPE